MESADKPGSVIGQPFIWDARRHAPRAANPGTVRVARSFPYLALLQVGFALPRVLPPARCALTAPFHPYRPAQCDPRGRRRCIFCGTFR